MMSLEKDDGVLSAIRLDVWLEIASPERTIQWQLDIKIVLRKSINIRLVFQIRRLSNNKSFFECFLN